MNERIEQAAMTLDEAIQHCIDKSNGCDLCSQEHKQLAQWLQELKELRKYQWISVDKELPKKKGFYLIKDEDSVFVNEWDGDEEEPEEMYWVEDAEPTHWMQIPPTEGGDE